MKHQYNTMGGAKVDRPRPARSMVRQRAPREGLRRGLRRKLGRFLDGSLCSPVTS